MALNANIFDQHSMTSPRRDSSSAVIRRHVDDTRRVHVHMNGATFERLTAIKEYSEAASVSAVIRHALQVYEVMMTAERDGAKITIEEPDGTKSRIVLVV